MSPEQAAKALEKMAFDLQRMDDEASSRTQQKATQEAGGRSSGTVSAAQLARPLSSGGYGRPYGYGPFGSAGRRGPIPYGDPSRINSQTGLFRSLWQTRPFGSKGWDLINTASYARWLIEGTDVAVPRPIDYQIGAAVTEDLERFIGNRMKRIIPK